MTLCAHNICYSYPNGRSVLHGVSLEVKPGELLGIIGPNGSGKSTLLRVMAGLLHPEQGNTHLDGRNLNDFRSTQLAHRIAFLPQMVQATFSFTCEEAVAQGRYPHLSALGFLSREDTEIVRRCMRLTDTESLAKRPLAELSGGERQRVMIASILAQQADHILLDEPTAALDIHHQAHVFEILRQFVRQGLAVAVVVHDLNLAAQFCDRLALISSGQVAAQGTASDVLRADNLAPVYGGNIAVGENPLTRGPLVTVLLESLNQCAGQEN